MKWPCDTSSGGRRADICYWTMIALLIAAVFVQDVEALVERAGRESKVKAKIGLSVATEKGGVLLEQRGGDPLILASNTKLFTTAAALARLGPSWTFRTVVGLEGAELHVFGACDPNISGRAHGDDPTAIFKGWAAKLRALGVTRLDAIVLHSGPFERTPLHPDWIAARHDQDQWWCAPVGPLSLNDNCVDVIYEAGAREGDPARLTLRPDTGFVKIVNRSKTVGAAPKAFGFVRRDGTNEIIVNGELKLGTPARTHWVAIRDPAGYFGTVLRETLERAGIAVSGGVRETESALKDHPGLRVVTIHESRLDETIRVCNTVSQNFYAEMVCRALGAAFKGPGSTASGLEVVKEFLERDVKATGVTLSDASGLSRANRAPAAVVRRLLEYMLAHPYADAWMRSLAVNGGDEGTLRRRMTGFRGAVTAKTGHVSGVSTLSGYLTARSGDTIVFSILANDCASSYDADRFQDRLLELLHGAD